MEMIDMVNEFTRREMENRQINIWLFNIQDEIDCKNCRQIRKCSHIPTHKIKISYCVLFKPRRRICKVLKCQYYGSGKFPCRRVRRDRCFLLYHFQFRKTGYISENNQMWINPITRLRIWRRITDIGRAE